MDSYHWTAYAIYLSDLLIRTFLSLRVIMRRLPVGVSLAWLAIILIFPFVGAAAYLLIGEYRLGPGRARRGDAYRKSRGDELLVIDPRDRVDPGFLSPESAALARLAQTTLGAVPLAGNALDLLENTEAALSALIKEIDAAASTCYLEFYIWSVGGRADDVGAALIRAAHRGVECRVLVDALGSGRFLKSAQCRQLRASGVHVEDALAFGLLQLLFVRPDLRMHRKIVIIDGVIAFTGSMNVADPALFKHKAGVGQWVDALVRLRGPTVNALAEVFREDWFLETGELLETHRPADGKTHPGTSVIQALATGPGEQGEAIEQVVLMALYAAKSEVLLTTPYFVPSEALLAALFSAAARGVKITLIVPAKIDSRLVHFASRAFQEELLKAGVCMALFKGGLLHTKSITVDGSFSLFGSLNLDPRSMRLDLEITLAIYDADFTVALRRLQQFYLSNSEILNLAACQARTMFERLVENSARLMGPVL